MSVNIANVLAENGHDSMVIATHKGGPLANFLLPNIPLHILNKKNSKDIKSFLKLKSIIKEFKPEIIHAHSSSVFWACLLKIFFPKLKIIWHDHFGLSDQLEKYPRKNYIFISRWIDAIISVNKTLETWAKENLKVPQNCISYIANFPYLGKIDKIDTNEITIINIANFRVQKDQLNLVAAISIVEKKHKNIKVLLIGNLSEETWVNEVKQKIESLNLSNIITITGPINDVKEILGKAKIGILSSSSEGLPVSLLEYGLAELSVVTTDVGQCKEVLGNGEFGWIVPPSSPNELATALIDAIENKEKSLLLASKFKQHVLTHYGSIAFMQSYNKIITAF